MISRRTLLAAGAAAFAAPAEAAQPWLEPLARLPASSAKGDLRAMINGMAWLGGHVVVWDARGAVYALQGSRPTLLFRVTQRYLQGQGARSGGLRWVTQNQATGLWYTSQLELPKARACRILHGAYPATLQAVVTEWDLGRGAHRDVLAVAMPAVHHPVDTLAWHGGQLFICVGDGGFIDPQQTPDPYHQAQLPGSPLGKVLRINPDGSIPLDNPWGNEAYAIGLRHPMCMHMPYIAEIGADSWERLIVLRKGANYGWSSSETGAGFEPPLALLDRRPWPNYASCGAPLLPDGRVLWGDLVSGRLLVTDPLRGGYSELHLQRSLKQLVGTNGRVDMRIGVDQHGQPLVSSKRNGMIYRLHL